MRSVRLVSLILALAAASWGQSLDLLPFHVCRHKPRGHEVEVERLAAHHTCVEVKQGRRIRQDHGGLKDEVTFEQERKRQCREENRNQPERDFDFRGTCRSGGGNDGCGLNHGSNFRDNDAT